MVGRWARDWRGMGMEDPPGLPHCPQGKQDQSTAAPVNLRFAPLVSGLPFRPGAAPPELLEHQPGKQHFCFHPRTPEPFLRRCFFCHLLKPRHLREARSWAVGACKLYACLLVTMARGSAPFSGCQSRGEQCLSLKGCLVFKIGEF